jgi:SAM-dependent methyltransferase
MSLKDLLAALWLPGRIAKLERRLTDPVRFAELLRPLGVKTRNGWPHWNYYQQRFSDYELALMNLKVLAYHLGQSMTDRLPVSTAGAPPRDPVMAQMCLQRDIESEWAGFWSREMRRTRHYHRKNWELCYIAQVLSNAGKLAPGTRGLGFGCGEEPLPSLFAKYGASIVATDQPAEAAEKSGWTLTNQHAADVERLRQREICPDDAKLARIDLRYVDMNAIPADFAGGFDFCWSACAVEHLGSIEKGLAFIENAMTTLKPGGVAVHTLEFGLANDDETIDNYPTVLFQQRHLRALAERLERAGYRVAPFNFDRGDGLLDQFVDVGPWQSDHVSVSSQLATLKSSFDGFICTSFGVIVSVPKA